MNQLQVIFYKMHTLRTNDRPPDSYHSLVTMSFNMKVEVPLWIVKQILRKTKPWAILLAVIRIRPFIAQV